MFRVRAQVVTWAIVSVMVILPHAHAASRQTAVGAVDKSVIPLYVDDIMKEWKLDEPITDLVSMTMDESGEHVGLMFVDVFNEYRVYNDGKLVLKKKSMYEGHPNFFEMTEDGNLIFYIDPYELYVDGKRISSTGNDYAYSVGLDADDVYYRSKVTFIDLQTIRQYDLTTGRSKVLYEVDGHIAYMRRRGNSVYYSARQSLPRDGYYIFRNGKRVTKQVATSQPERFQISPKGDVYYFAQGGENFVLYRNEKAVHAGKGRGGFVEFDEKGNVFHAVVEETLGSSVYTVGFFKNNRLVRTGKIFDMEGVLASEGVMYATRVQTKADDGNAFKLLKNGRVIGQNFSFDRYRDYNGIAFGPRKRTYMRNWKDGRWHVYEDGKLILEKTFEDVFFIQASANDVKIYGTRP